MEIIEKVVIGKETIIIKTKAITRMDIRIEATNQEEAEVALTGAHQIALVCICLKNIAFFIFIMLITEKREHLLKSEGYTLRLMFIFLN